MKWPATYTSLLITLITNTLSSFLYVPTSSPHFDVIRLWSNYPGMSLRRWPRLWEKVVRNLTLVKEYGGVIEVNSAGLRKNMIEPYPTGEICRVCMWFSSCMCSWTVLLNQCLPEFSDVLAYVCWKAATVIYMDWLFVL